MTDPFGRVFRTLQQAVATDDDKKHRAMSTRALIELAHVLDTGHNPFDRKKTR